MGTRFCRVVEVDLFALDVDEPDDWALAAGAAA
jgi:hypothetical protein